MNSEPETSGWGQPFQLLPIFRERLWGRKSLSPFFPDVLAVTPIGEVWFTFNENETSRGGRLGDVLLRRPEILGSARDPEHPGICPLLVKLLFTTERLSVQVHPDDDYAQQRHQSLGKTEAWYVIDSQPPGEVAIGFREPLTPDRLRSAARSGEIENMLDWRRVEAGDTIFVPAGTVHAIGAGLTICEIQENSDITYRLHDYGRGRELHLDDGVRVSNLGPLEFRATPLKLAGGRDELLVSHYFRIERVRSKRRIHIHARLPYYVLLICLKGSGLIAGQAYAPGQCWIIPAQNEETTVEGPGSEWIVTYTATEALKGLEVG